MTHRIEHRCAQCDAVVGTTTRRRPTIGRSFAECGKCGAYVARTPYQEWPLMPSRTRMTLLLSSASVALTAGLAPGALLGGVLLMLGRRAELQIALGICALGFLFALGAWGTWLGRLLAGSRRRMHDPWYQAKLAQFAIQSNRRERAGAG